MESGAMGGHAPAMDVAHEMSVEPLQPGIGARLVEIWPVPDVVAHREITSGAVNRVVEIVTSTGRYFLRTYRFGSAELLGREHMLSGFVAEAGLPAISALKTRDGATFVEMEGGFHALFPAAPGLQLSTDALTRVHATNSGDLLGRLHQVLADYPSAGRRLPTLKWDGPAWVARLDRIETGIRARGMMDRTDETALAHLEAQRRWLADPNCVHERDLRGPIQVIHGDFHHGNLFFEGDTVCGIIDWEQSSLLPRAFEAVRAATYMFDLEPELTAWFLAAWQARTGAGVEELDQGAEAFGCLRDHWVWALEEVYLNSNDRARRYLPETPFRPFQKRWQGVLAAIS
jgi:homoserine kinase type II